MKTNSDPQLWDNFLEPARGFLDFENFEKLERGYKLDIAETIVSVAEAARSGEPIHEPLEKCLKSSKNNLLDWRLKDDVLAWATADELNASRAVSAAFDETVEPLAALENFLALLPTEVISGRGTRLAVASFFLMGRDAANLPIFRIGAVNDVRKLTSWDSNANNEIEEYEDALAMFNSFKSAAVAAGVKVDSALHAQGILYAIAKWQPDEGWAEDLRESVVRLRIDSGLDNGMMSFEAAVKNYDRALGESQLNSGIEQREAFVDRFPPAEWPSLTLDRYALGEDEFREGVSYGLEWGTNDCGSIAGGSSNKHLIFFAVSLNEYRFESKYKTAEESWSGIRAGVEELIDLASEGSFAAIDEVDALWAAPAVRLKLAWLYFPDQLMPIYSNNHLDFWLSIFDIDATDLDRIAKNRALWASLTEKEEFDGWETLEIMHFLYSWTSPNPGHQIFKIAPGDNARLWDDCLSNGHIRMGFDGTNDLSQFENDDELRSHFKQLNPEVSKSVATRTVRALRTFRDLEEGDIVVANEGTKKVIGIGRVNRGYEFRSDLDEYRHVVGVDWFDTAERSVDFGSAWIFTLVAIKPEDYHRILSDSTEPTVTIPVIPALHSEAERLLQRSGQIIFYGPPGTGKTYAARRHAAWLLGGGSSVPEAAHAFGQPKELAHIEAELLRPEETDERPSWVAVANPNYWSFDELFEKGSEQYDYGRLKKNYEDIAVGDEVFGYEATPSKKIVATARVTRALYETQEGKQHIDIEPVSRSDTMLSWESLKNDPVLASSEPMMHRMQGTLFRLEPHEASRIRVLAGMDKENGPVSSGVSQLTRVTFHPTYSYEDFIEGYKPTESGAGGLELEMRDGVFKRVCRAATADPDRPYVIMIDEINRGNVPKIFGELITLIEADKRGMALTLPQSGQSFHVPENVHIIATMNTADRSIHILDAALRRRFAFAELLPDPEVLTSRIGPLPLDGFLSELNVRIRSLVGREKQVGHAVLMKAGKPISSPSEFALSFKYELLPLLQEYTYGNYDDLTDLLGSDVIDSGNQTPRATVLDDPERLIEALVSHLELT